MREIKFRGKRVDNGEWVYGGYHKHIARQICPIGDKLNDSDIKHLIVQSGFADWNMPKPLQAVEVIPETVGQFTGLHDKNGVEIYEGDRLKRIGDDGDEIFIIEWNEQSGGFNLNYIYFGEIYDLEELWPDSQVIGNIHEQEEAND